MKPLPTKRKLGHRRRQMCHPYLLHDDQWGHPSARRAPKRPRDFSRARLMNRWNQLPPCFECPDRDDEPAS